MRNIVSNDTMAAAEPRFVAAGLVETTTDGPRLVAGKCTACGTLSFPKADVCTHCLGRDIASTHLSTEGTLYSFATVHQAPRNWIVPYHLGYVDLPENIRVLAHIEGAPAIGAKVRLAVARVGQDPSGTPLMSYVFETV